ncbi:RabGAP/TBC [Tilletiaria anomala UBC 951]|uniref:RabGAP/TBC n=1 Tax=Tilletiaria anomala (strain ATCC 24038 / CBS 436.72 / UBC 951) TaxID=1037660 RepID=A0A066W4E3_TILAU|nr:RabGAP/TBC [Tilletiaria anomala UBC 951]KDN45934.1 RabGAP/TBC [Tilletiaria anomala UBC 951]
MMAAEMSIAAVAAMELPPQEQKQQQFEGGGDRFHLLYSKSKVYVHPTPYARDNIAGYVALLRKGSPRPMANAANIYLAYMPEALLEERDELAVFVDVELRAGNVEGVKEVFDEECILASPPPARLASSAPPSTSSASTITSSPASLYAFSFPLSELYSFTLNPPTFSHWYGTMVLSLMGGVALPTLHFHDDESQSTILGLQRASSAAQHNSNGNDATTSRSGLSGSDIALHLAAPSGPPASSALPCTWGGDELLQQLRRYAHVLRSVVQANLFLLNPSRDDVELHTTPLFDDDAIDRLVPAPSSSTFGDGNRFTSDLHVHLPSAHRGNVQSAGQDGGVSGSSIAAADAAKMEPLVLWAKSTRLSFLSSMAQLTHSARQATHQVLSHPLARPVVGHLPGPVQTFAQAGPFPLGPISDAEWGRIAQQSGTGEYDSARVYLAKWARLVAEEGERNKRKEEALTTAAAAAAASGRAGGGRGGAASGTEYGESAHEDVEIGQLGVFELLAKSADLPRPPTSRVQGSPLTLSEFDSLFDTVSGRPLHSAAAIQQRIFAHGLADLPARRAAWPFLLGVVPWHSTRAEREQLWRARAAQYWTIKRQWMEQPALLEREDVLEQRHRIRVDCLRTDRSHPVFRATPPAPATADGPPSSSGPDRQGATAAASPPPLPPPATMSASIVQEKQAGHSAATSNGNVVKLGEILLTFGMWESGKLGGYVQGMSDLCSLLYIVCAGDEVRTFWCFVALMERMAPNFYADQSGMKKLLLELQKLIAIMDPPLYAHLDKTDSLNLFFCFRWLLICFKREFPLDDLFKLWECIWSAEFASPDAPAAASSEHGKDCNGHDDGDAPRDGVSNSFSLFVALAVLESHRDSIMRYLDHFDEMLQYMNGLSGHIDVESTIARAEVLALALRVLFEQKDQAKASEGSAEDAAHGPTAIHARLTDDKEDLRALVFRT